MVSRFGGHYPNGFEPTFYPEAFLSPLHLKKPSRIGVCFMGDLFGDWVNPIEQFIIPNHELGGNYLKTRTLRRWVFDAVENCPQHTFVFLTKNPKGMKAWSPFPDNCEAGFSATNQDEFLRRLVDIRKVEANVRWCSLEPLLNWSAEFKTDWLEYLDWVAIGALTGTERQLREIEPRYPELTPFQIERGQWGLMPPIAWIKNIVEQCDACGTKVFIKENLYRWIVNETPIDPIFLQSKGDIAGFPVATLRQEYGARVRP